MIKNGIWVPEKLFFMVMGRLTMTIRVENGFKIFGPFCGAFAEHQGGFETPSKLWENMHVRKK